MTAYYFEIIDQLGKKNKLIIEAASLEAAKDELRVKKYLVTKQLKKNASVSSKTGKFSKKSLLFFIGQLAHLLKAKLPLYQALLTLAEQLEGEKEHAIVFSLAELLKEGYSLSEAMQKQEKSFPPMVTAIVAAGEEAGMLEESLTRLASILQEQQTMQKKIVSALIYPALLFGFCLLVLFAMLFFVLPALESVLNMENLHGYSAFVFGCSTFIRTFWPILLLGTIVITVCAWIIWKRSSKKWFYQLLLQLPILKNYIIHANLMRFFHTLSALLTGGVQMITALTLSRFTLTHPLLKQSIESLQTHVIEGSTLGIEIKAIWWMPKLVFRLVDLGEQTGTLPSTLEQIALFYREDLEKKLFRITELAQPIMILIMGAIVGLIVLSVLIPLTDMSNIM